MRMGQRFLTTNTNVYHRGDILQRLWSTRDVENERMSPWVFPSKVSVTGHLYTVSKSLERITEKTGLPIRLHDLRRTFVSVANGTGIPYYTIKRLVNHSSGGDVTASVYNVMDVDDLRENRRRTCERIQRIKNTKLMGVLASLGRLSADIRIAARNN